MKTKNDIGEFGLIDRIKKTVGGSPRNSRVLLGIGDDAALFRVPADRVCAVTTDTLVEGTHFDLAFTSFRDLGHKAMAANLSDIAAMGGRPLLAVVSLSLTPETKVSEIDALYAGMKSLARRHRVSIAGGDIVRSRELSLTLTVIGECHQKNIGLRSGAKPGDAVLVTGTLGASQAGLDLLKSNIKNKKSKLVRKHLRPEPRIKEALLLASRFRLHGMIDISDGLSSELNHMSRESGLGLVIDQGALPVAAEAVKIGTMLHRDPQDYCLAGGEEYELLFTLPPKQAILARDLIIKETGTGCCIIGQAVAGRGVKMVHSSGRIRKLQDRGYKHF
jgi:thiamine-monophosphate kinase